MVLGGNKCFPIKTSKAVFSCPEKAEKCTVARFGFIWQIVFNR
jgi:hypothetical protein